MSARGSAILIDAASGEALYEKKPDERRLIASTTKIMTALCGHRKTVSLTKRSEVPKECERVGGSSMYLRAGDDVTVRELLYGLLLMSGNDAGLALAYHCGKGDVETFVMMMNMYAQELRALRIRRLKTPHGLDGAQHYSTARDMARLAAHAMRNETFREIVGDERISRYRAVSCTITISSCGASTAFAALKPGLRSRRGTLPGELRGAGGQAVCRRDASAPDDWNDHEKLYRAVFDALEECTLVKAGERAALVPSVRGDDAAVAYDGDFTMWLTPYEYETAEVQLNLPSFVYSGRLRGERAGSGDIYVRDTKVGSVGLIYE